MYAKFQSSSIPNLTDFRLMHLEKNVKFFIYIKTNEQINFTVVYKNKIGQTKSIFKGQ